MKRRIAILSIVAALAMTTLAVPTVGFAEANGSEEAAQQGDEMQTPVKIQGVKAVRYSYNKIKLSWTASQEVSGYQILKKNSKGKYIVIKTITDNSVKMYTDTVTPNKTNYYRVRAYNAPMTRAASATYQLGPLSETASAKASVGSISGFKAAPTSCGIKVSWKKISYASGYAIYRYYPSKHKYVSIKSVKGTSYTNKKLTCSKKYYFKVRAYKVIDGKKYYGAYTSAKSAKMVSRSNYYNSTTASSIIKTAKTKLGKAYIYGAAGPNAFDCSGYVYWTLRNAKGNTIKPARSSATGMYYSKLKKYSVGKDKSKLKKGDIIMFSNSGSDKKMCHTGIYYGNGKVIHASTPATGVTISPLKYQARVAAIIRLP